MEYTDIIYEVKNRVGIITLNRPKAMNALTSNTLKEIKAVLEQIESDDQVRALILTGGEEVFAAGFDIKEISTLETPEDAHRMLSNIHPCYNKLAGFKLPVIAATSGLVFGGGLELALACDVRIASDTARFAVPEINLGLIPGAGGTQRLPRIVGMGRACEMLYSGKPVNAASALGMGLVNDVVAKEILLASARQMADRFAAQPGFALNLIKKVVQTGMDTDLNSALAYEARCFEMLFATPDMKEGVSAFVEKRRPEFK